MEAPSVNQNQSKKIKINYENKDYELTISYLINLKININCTNTKERYENQYTFEQIIKQNRYFLMSESTKDIYDELSNLIDKQKINISYSKKDIILKIPLPSLKIKEAVFILKPTKISTTDEIDDLKQLLNEQNIKITNLESEIKIIKEQILKINQLEKKISSLESNFYSNKNETLCGGQNNNKKDNQIQKFKPIGKFEWNNKIYDMYSKEQFEENKRCW